MIYMYKSRQARCKLQGVFYIILKRHKLWSANGYKLDVNFAFHWFVSDKTSL